jgi:hypothetical protein
VSVALISTDRGVFIGVQGGVTDLVKLVTHEVLAGLAMWPTGLATWPAGHGVQPPPTFSLVLPSTLSWRVSSRSQLARGYKVGPAGQGVWPANQTLGPLVSGLCTLPPRVRYTPGVTLIFVEFQISL